MSASTTVFFPERYSSVPANAGTLGNLVRIFIVPDLQRQGVNFCSAFSVVHFNEDMARTSRVGRNQGIVHDSEFPNGARFRAKPSATSKVTRKNRALEIAP